MDDPVTELRYVFDRIAPGWYNRFHWTRFGAELEQLAGRWQKGRLLNLGCGHGADFLPFKGPFELHGVDFSAEMLRQSARYGAKHGLQLNCQQADVRQLPYPDDYFDWAISVATFHHLPGPVEILNGLVELLRVVKPGGEAFLTVWNRWQPRFWFKPRQVLVPWKTGPDTCQRYYYLLSFGQARSLAAGAGWSVLESGPEHRCRLPVKAFCRNVCLLLQKPA